MNHKDLASLNRVLSQLDRRSKRSQRRFTTAPLVLALGLVLADCLLLGLVLPVWPSVMSSATTDGLGGIHRVVWHLAEYCQDYQKKVQVGILVVSVLTLVLSYRMKSIRLLAWLAAVGVVASDAVILLTTFLACIQAAATS
jgi:hypothetical protein